MLYVNISNVIILAFSSPYEIGGSRAVIEKTFLRRQISFLEKMCYFESKL